jgi:uncharacterized protein (DUF2384 family)
VPVRSERRRSHEYPSFSSCNHSSEQPEPPELSVEAVDLVAAIEAASDVLKRATEMVADRYPEDLAEKCLCVD